MRKSKGELVFYSTCSLGHTQNLLGGSEHQEMSGRMRAGHCSLPGKGQVLVKFQSGTGSPRFFLC